MHRKICHLITAAALASCLLPCTSAKAQEANARAHIAIVGDADKFNVGQDGFCGKRIEIDNPSSVSFQIPGGRSTWFYIRTKIRTPVAWHTCEGDFSFTPETGHLHIIRYTLAGDVCKLEMFKSVPGQTPQPASFKREPGQACILQ